MPVRSTIHWSDVSNICSRSWLVSTFGGNAVPHPVITAPRIPLGVLGMRFSSWICAVGSVPAGSVLAGSSAGAQPGDRLTQRHPFPGHRDVTLQHAVEGRADLGVA